MEVVERRRGGAKIHSETCDGEISDFTKRWKFEEGGGGILRLMHVIRNFRKLTKKSDAIDNLFEKCGGETAPPPQPPSPSHTHTPLAATPRGRYLIYDIGLSFHMLKWFSNQ